MHLVGVLTSRCLRERHCLADVCSQCHTAGIALRRTHSLHMLQQQAGASANLAAATACMLQPTWLQPQAKC